METINSMASAAAKAVWGDNTNTKDNETETKTMDPTTTNMNNETRGQEPISGKQGDVSKGEPFDAGNMESQDAAAHAKTPTTEQPIETPASQSKGPTSDHPSTTGDHGGFKAAQADVRDPESATADPKTEQARKNVDTSGDGLDSSENPAKVDGPGPKPLDEVARERGGDAGKGVPGGDSKPDSADPSAETAGDDSGKDKGSGEQYVKSSGLQADGGDFDATKPGAGREADRLLEEKGIANPAVAAGKKPETESPSEEGSPDSKEKKSLKDKIKAKLHKN